MKPKAKTTSRPRAKKYRLLSRVHDGDRFTTTLVYRRGRLFAGVAGLTKKDARELARDLGAEFVGV